MDWATFIALGHGVTDDALQARKDEVGIEDVNMICYTGGTTGVLKGALRTHLSCVTSPFKICVALGLDSTSVICTNFLFFHTAGMNSGTTLAMIAGARLVIPAQGFDPAATLEAFNEEGCTYYSGTPTTVRRILDLPGIERSRLKLNMVQTGAAECSPALMARAQRELGVAICIGYGGTEAGTLSITLPSDPEEKRINTVGRICAYSEVKLIDPVSGRVVRRGHPGEVCSRGVSVMNGYYDAPDRTDQVLDSGRWYHSGDLGTIDDEGYLHLLGRIDDMIIRGGENVQSADVEDVVRSWSGVIDVQVVGVPDPIYGQEIAAWIVAESSLDEAGLREHCRALLAHYQTPRWFFQIDAFPQTGVGKPDKSKLRRMVHERAKR
jgi:fatty-acyl-CoA synthase